MASSKSTPVASEDPSSDQDAPGEASLLVSEFPPPPNYYKQAAGLTPPAIPQEALTNGTLRAAAAAARARAESERLRLGDDADKTDAILGGVAVDQEEEEGDVVAVFGEIVEDPLLVEPLDRCEDPTVVREEVKRLNQQVLQGFVKLVQDLVHRPMENKYVVGLCMLNSLECLADRWMDRNVISHPCFTSSRLAVKNDTRRVVPQHISHVTRVQQVSRAPSSGVVD
jgi:hypothetical protein